MQDIVIRLCGPYPDNYIKVEIENNPDFVFTPDPLFPTTQLADEEENLVYVNSFTECEHYVMGGWDYDIVVEKLKVVEENDSIRNFQPPVTGEMIMKEFGIPPSRPIGDIKKAIKEAILEGDIKNDKEEAFELMLKLGNEMGLKRV